MELARNMWLGFASSLPGHCLDLPPLLLAPSESTNPYVDVDLGNADRLLSTASRRSAEPALGLYLGMHAPMQTLGFLGEVVTHAPTLRAAIDDLHTYLPLLLFPQSRFQLLETGAAAHLIYEPPFSDRRAARFCVELALAFAARIGRQMVPGNRPHEVRVRHAAPSYAARYPELLGCPVHFGATRNEIVFAREMLDVTQPFVDNALWAQIKRRAGELLVDKRSGERFDLRVKHVLRYEVDLGWVKPFEVARRLSVSPRALRDKLTQQRQSFTRLLDQVRCELALELICDPLIPLKAIAERVGFSEVSAFHRAFRRWTGSTPARYRVSTLAARVATQA